jgi:hypothetical protein
MALSESEFLARILQAVEPSPGPRAGVRRGGRLALVLPHDRQAAARTLSLYQPQRPAARIAAAVLRGLAGCGVHRTFPNVATVAAAAPAFEPPLPSVRRASCGVMLGNPEHRIRRAIASYRTEAGWEVAKIAEGDAGAELLAREGDLLGRLHGKHDAVPERLGFHQGGGLAWLRMPYLTGQRLRPHDAGEAVKLLDRWVLEEPAMPMEGFPEWPAILAALGPLPGGKEAIGELADGRLVPVLRHGDFARWNLLRTSGGGWIALDWEWGLEGGMPGLDLVHFHGQEARLVKGLPGDRAIDAIADQLGQPAARAYLGRTGWAGNPLAPALACLAFKQGAGHQDNREALEACLKAYLRC